jgi:hypothetical protein
MSQCERILAYLEEGNTITPADAYSRFGTLALHSRIAELRRQGYAIKMAMRSNAQGRWGEYWLEDDVLNEQNANYNRMIGDSLRR